MSELDALRQEIDSVTKEMVELFERRLEISRDIARYKKENDLPIFQPEREKELITRYRKIAKNPDLVEAFLISIMDLGKCVQKEEIGK